MTKNTAYYKAAFAKSEAASPYAKINPHMKGHGMHNSSMKMNHGSAMEKHSNETTDNLAMNKSKDYIPRTVQPPEDITPQTQKNVKASGKKKANPLTKMAGKSHMKGTMEQHREHHKAEHSNRDGKKKSGTYIGPGDFKMMKTPGDTD